MINTSIGKYKISKLIGEGGMASVYEAEHEMLGTKVAIKVLNPILSANAEIKTRFRNEAKLMASLDHPNITKVIDFDEQPQQLSIVMEFLNGEDLDQKIKRNGPLSEKEISDIFSQTLSAFHYAHEKGIVHRDIKPSNIYILSNGHVKILDFGIAKLFGQGNEMTQTGTQMGTPIYMSPEQVKGDKSIDHRSDIYSLGVTMFFAINGKPPYNSTTESQFDIFTKIVYQELPEFSIQSKFNEMVLKACNKNREERFQSCSDYLEAFKLKYTNMLGNNENTKVNRGGEDLKGSVTEVKEPTKTELNKNEKKSKSTLFNFIRILSIILLISSFIALVGSIMEYIQFETSKDIDNSYLGPWSAWSAIITGVLSLISVVFFLVKKTSIIKSSTSFLVSALAFWVLMTTEDNYRSFWRPYWDSDISIYCFDEMERNKIEQDWIQGNISIDSLNALEKKWKNRNDSIISTY
jgi:serine/threonine protein kinase